MQPYLWASWYCCHPHGSLLNPSPIFILLLPRPPPPPAFIAAFLLTPALGICCSASFLLPILFLLLFPSMCPRISAWLQDKVSSPPCLSLHTLPGHPHPGVVATVSPVQEPCFVYPEDKEQWGIRGPWPVPRRLWLPGSIKSPARPSGRFCTRSQRGGITPISDAIGTTPNRLLTLELGGAGPLCQNSCKVLFHTDKTHILLQPHSQKSLDHFSWNFPKKVSLRLTPCKGYFSQNSLSLAKL